MIKFNNKMKSKQMNQKKEVHYYQIKNKNKNIQYYIKHLMIKLVLFVDKKNIKDKKYKNTCLRCQKYTKITNKHQKER